MSVLSKAGLVDVDVRGSRVRSTIGAHWNAIQRYAATGDSRVLGPFDGASVAGAMLEHRPDKIEELLRRGQLDLDDIYVGRA